MSAELSAAIPEDIDRLACAALKRAGERDLKLATAESCTGGLLASLLTDIEGLSRHFERGYVVYTEDAKHELLGVPRAMLEQHTAVSKSVAIAMAEGARDKSRADVAVSITGYAGPGGEGAEAGLVHFACARAGRATRHREEHFGELGRGGVRVAALRVALQLLNDAVRSD